MGRVGGTHSNAKRGHFWLFTTNGKEYWPHTRINLQPDGHWKERVNINSKPGPRTATVLLVWVSDFCDALFADIRDRSNKASFWGPVEIPPDPSQFSVVQALVLNVQTKPA